MTSVAAALLPWLAGCGQTGPLYLPEDEGATVITRPGPAAGATTPAAPETPAAPTGPATAPPATAPPASAPAGTDAAVETPPDRRPRR